MPRGLGHSDFRFCPKDKKGPVALLKGLKVCRLRMRTLIAVGVISLGIAIAQALTTTLPAQAATLPEIRLNKSNHVPACATPEALMAFTRARNPNLDRKYDKIAHWYLHWGKTWQVRWDYAYFQMLLETNYLKYRRGNGKRGDVKPHQNNFAGLGATGGGVPGDRFPDVSTGVLAQIQHLVAYSGQLMTNPTAPRTKLKQSDIVNASKRLRRPVRYSDLTRRWAADRSYHYKIKSIADLFAKKYCTGARPQRARRPVLASTTFWPGRPTWKPARTEARVAASVPSPTQRRSQRIRCQISKASYGGRKTLLIRAVKQSNVHYTALSVLDGFEESMANQFMKTHARGGIVLGTFSDQAAALRRANMLCPTS